MTTVKLIVALAAHLRLSLQQLDISTAYLNGEIQETLYMEPPKQLTLEYIIRDEPKKSEIRKKADSMFKELQNGNKVCLLKKPLYKLRQAGRSWYQKLDSVLRTCGALPTSFDTCLYTLNEDNNLTMILIYVDDILIATGSNKSAARIKSNLSDHFDIKDMGEVKQCLGI